MHWCNCRTSPAVLYCLTDGAGRGSVWSPGPSSAGPALPAFSKACKLVCGRTLLALQRALCWLSEGFLKAAWFMQAQHADHADLAYHRIPYLQGVLTASHAGAPSHTSLCCHLGGGSTERVPAGTKKGCSSGYTRGPPCLLLACLRVCFAWATPA